MTTKYRPVFRDGAGALASQLSFLLREPLTSVHYGFTDPADVEISRDQPGAVIAIDAIRLETGSGDGGVVTWGVAGVATGMAVVELDRWYATESIDATDSPPWANLAGAPLTDVFPAWQESSGTADSLWALRLTQAESEVVIAIAGQDARPVVDELWVTSDAALARTLRPLAARTDARGASSSLFAPSPGA